MKYAIVKHTFKQIRGHYQCITVNNYYGKICEIS